MSSDKSLADQLKEMAEEPVRKARAECVELMVQSFPGIKVQLEAAARLGKRELELCVNHKHSPKIFAAMKAVHEIAGLNAETILNAAALEAMGMPCEVYRSIIPFLNDFFVLRFKW